MDWANLHPRLFRRHAVHLMLGVGVATLSAAPVRAGIVVPALNDRQDVVQTLSDGHVDMADLVESSAVASDQPADGASNAIQSGVVADPGGPGLTGENWFAGLQEQLNQTGGMSTPARPPIVIVPPATGVNATAIPSLPSFWSGLSCCGLLIAAGMIPRVRRVFR
jgi:hypothetical protein